MSSKGTARGAASNARSRIWGARDIPPLRRACCSRCRADHVGIPPRPLGRACSKPFSFWLSRSKLKEGKCSRQAQHRRLRGKASWKVKPSRLLRREQPPIKSPLCIAPAAIRIRTMRQPCSLRSSGRRYSPFVPRNRCRARTGPWVACLGTRARLAALGRRPRDHRRCR